MNVTRKDLVLGAVLFVLAAGPVCAHGYKRGAIEIAHPWCLDTYVEGTKDVVVSMEIKSKDARGDKLLHVDTTVATSIEIRGQNGDALPVLFVPGAATLSLGQNRAHIRLIGLKKALVVYDTLPITLVFERAGRMAVDVLVEEPNGVKS